VFLIWRTTQGVSEEYYPQEIVSALRHALLARGTTVEDGLTDPEIEAAEKHCSIRFPPDLRTLLQTILPVGDGWPRWRDLEQVVVFLFSSSSLTLHLPSRFLRLFHFLFPFPNLRQCLIQLKPNCKFIGGVLFDVEHNNFWHTSWGKRSEDLPSACRVAREWMELEAPRLIPVYHHRCMGSGPLPGQPVLSIHQTDCIVYGTDLADYLNHEFKLGVVLDKREAKRVAFKIPFWQELDGDDEDLEETEEDVGGTEADTA
jgi:hypothetical protein